MVKRLTYTASSVNGKVVLTYSDGGVTHQVAHKLPDQPSADAAQQNFFRNMPRKERYTAMATMLQPLLRRHGDHQSYKLPYKHISRVTGVPVRYLVKARPGKPPTARKSKPEKQPDVLRAMPEFRQEYLEAHSHVSVPQRVQLMNMSYPESPPWTLHHLRSAYSRLGIKYKMVRINRTARRPDQVALIAKDREFLRLMKEHLLLG
jgi:hypothetical protein